MLVFHIAWSRYRLVWVKEPISGGGEPRSGCGGHPVLACGGPWSTGRVMDARALLGDAPRRICDLACARGVNPSRRWALPPMAVRLAVADAGLGKTFLREAVLQTIVCAVDESPGAAEAIAVAATLSERLGLRLVLAHVADGYRRTNGADIGGVQEYREGQRLLERIARKHSLESAADRRAEVGDRASELSRIAGEEAAVVIVMGSRGRYRRGRGQLSRLSTELRSTAPCPVVVVPPRRWR
jgi:nucleotide-binding universal stress UspA family protein